jgi:large subunit ribosomal protein L13
MVPKTKMGRAQLRKLRVYAGAEHPHEAQQPVVIDVAALNRKNKRRA